MRVVIPYTDRDPKSRLAPVLSEPERRAFARVMLGDVVAVVRDAGHEPELLVPAPIDFADADTAVGVDGVPTTVDDRALTPAVDAVLDRLGEGVAEVGIVMADLALATPAALRRLTAVGGEVGIAPGRGGGTNALVVREPSFSVDYHGASYRDHREAAATAGVSVGVVDSMRLATDIDEPADLAEVLLHGDGRARGWLVDAGVELDASGGRVGVRRG
ncbi:2-phospho-L-lactate guanylyltransferase [Halobellus salinus]|uniref:2-phospho-L-lactate guanylyltransferase n=1 Tax=Halobellus salinus TaxID=931585 RepID=A0A830EGP3_9EURY|nr:2-phospho-L-lactate guanylyltransferase [Halobellus salinus]GGJ08090.1 2-phospho-L-lactate guanylyltransferase [Halobellus salinus]SMP27933.1 phospholactate guanylyltransferase [Halobellus salinus]